MDFKCRFCMKVIEKEDSIEINVEIENHFIDLTQMSLVFIRSQNFICQQCLNDLTFCSEFRKSIIQKQKLFLDEETSNRTEISLDNKNDEDGKSTTNCLMIEEKLQNDQKKECHLCGKSFKNLQEHQKIVHNQEKRFQCDFCDYSCYFKTKIIRHLQKHIPKHLRFNRFPCEFCDFVATRKDVLKTHNFKIHQDVREKTSICQECHKSFYNNSQLNIHIRSVHEKIRNHLCNLCGKSFFNLNDYESHVKRHGKKNLSCEICGNLFYCQNDLKRHLKIHTVPKLTCEIDGCGKKFHENSKLNQHIRVKHEGLKDFYCDYCNLGFAQFNNLKRHINSVHKSLRINCIMNGCSYTVARKDKYKNHLITHHKLLDEKTRDSIMRNVKLE